MESDEVLSSWSKARSLPTPIMVQGHYYEIEEIYRLIRGVHERLVFLHARSDDERSRLLHPRSVDERSRLLHQRSVDERSRLFHPRSVDDRALSTLSENFEQITGMLRRAESLLYSYVHRYHQDAYRNNERILAQVTRVKEEIIWLLQGVQWLNNSPTRTSRDSDDPFITTIHDLRFVEVILDRALYLMDFIRHVVPLAPANLAMGAAISSFDVKSNELILKNKKNYGLMSCIQDERKQKTVRVKSFSLSARFCDTVSTRVAGICVYVLDTSVIVDGSIYDAHAWIYLLSSDSFPIIENIRGQVHGSMFKYIFDREPDDKVLATGLSVHERKIIYRSYTLNGNDDEWHDSLNEASEAEKVAIHRFFGESYYYDKY